jgi:hypothetical protein
MLDLAAQALNTAFSDTEMLKISVAKIQKLCASQIPSLQRLFGGFWHFDA